MTQAPHDNQASAPSARTGEATARTAEVLRSINEFAASLSALHSEDDILWDITRRCISTLGFEDCVVYLHDEERGILVQRAAYGPKNPRDREIVAPIEIPMGRGIVGSAALARRSVNVPDTRLDPRYILDDAARLSEIAVPIAAEGRVLGVIDSEHSRPGFFTPDHVSVLESIASICANKIIRARAEARLRELNHELERRIAERTAELVETNAALRRQIEERDRAEQVQRALLEISEATHAAEDLQSLYARIHGIIGTLMPAKNFYIAVLDETSGIISFPYHCDVVDPRPEPRKARRGMTEYVIRTGRATLADLHEIQRLKDAGEYIQSGHASAIWLGVPLTVGGRTFGVMAVQDQDDPDAFGEEEKRILSFVAGQTALTIDRKRAEDDRRAWTARLLESEQRFSRAFHAIPANVTLVRLSDQQITEVNEAFLQSTGYNRDEVIGRSTAELALWAYPEDRAEFFRRLRESGRVRGLESTFYSRTGEVIEFQVSAETIEIEREPHVLALAINVSERKRAEAELLRTLARERELSRLKSSFVSLVSHEFRTPIGVIHSSAEILERYLDFLPPNERTEHIKAIQNHAWRMAVLMEEVLIFGRAEAGRLEFRPVVFDLADACLRWADELGRATDQRCSIHVSLDGLPPQAVGDQDLLRHILANLLSNAIKYSPGGSVVAFSVVRDGSFAVFSVADRGIGIPEADRARLFTAFQRGSNVRHLPGTGLGLTVIRHCLDLHHGRIQIHSREGDGTRVEVRIPLFPSPDTPLPPPPPPFP